MKKRYFLVGYAHENGFGRMFFGTTDPITDGKIIDWEKECGMDSDKQHVCIISISEVDGLTSK